MVAHPEGLRTGNWSLDRLILTGFFLLSLGILSWLISTHDRVDADEVFVAQMRQAALGATVSSHVFGGNLSVASGNGQKNVTAEHVPSRSCVHAGWRLARDGAVVVNGVLPLRLSASRLSELCSQNGDTATLMWVPEKK